MTGLRDRFAAPEVVVFTRDNCGLCATAERLADAEAGGCPLELVDIDLDEELTRRYHVRVPVVTVDGREVAEGQVVPGTIAAAVRTARWRRLRGIGPTSSGG